jgi:hypothetical protein
VKEATLRDVLRGTAPAERLAAEVHESVEFLSGSSRRVRIEDLPAGTEVTITPEMLVRLCDAFLAGTLSGTSLEITAFAILASDHFHWSDEDEVVGRVLHDWAAPEVNWELTAANVRMFRDWLTGRVRPSSEPDITTDSLSGMGLLRRATKVSVQPGEDSGSPKDRRS